MASLYLKDGTNKIIKKNVSGWKLAADTDCCCREYGVCINICNANKWSDTPRDAKINGTAITAPNMHIDTTCGGGFYWSDNISPDPDYCDIGFTCCGQEAGGTTYNCLGCDANSYTGSTYSAGAYPATGCKNEDCGCYSGSSNGGWSHFQTCGTDGDCSGDLVKASFSAALLVSGSNTFTSALTATGRCNGSYGVVEIAKMVKISGTWSFDSWFLAPADTAAFYYDYSFSAGFTL